MGFGANDEPKLDIMARRFAAESLGRPIAVTVTEAVTFESTSPGDCKSVLVDISVTLSGNGSHPMISLTFIFRGTTISTTVDPCAKSFQLAY